MSCGVIGMVFKVNITIFEVILLLIEGFSMTNYSLHFLLFKIILVLIKYLEDFFVFNFIFFLMLIFNLILNLIIKINKIIDPLIFFHFTKMSFNLLKNLLYNYLYFN
jgi:hypothetical protein